MEAKQTRMSESAEQLMLSQELLAVMRGAAAIAQNLAEPFITTRALLLAILDDPQIGTGLADVLPREKIAALPIADARVGATRLPEPQLAPGERAAIVRYNTLAFRIPNADGVMWLSREAFAAFGEGARRAEGPYLPKHLALGIAADAIRNPGVLAALHISPGSLIDAVEKL